MDFMNLTDGYKLDHKNQYPDGTEYVYSNFTARSTRVPGQTEVTFFGLQYFLQRYFGEAAVDDFFGMPKEYVCRRYRDMATKYLGPDAADKIGTDHIAALHELGYIPLSFCAVPEGTAVPLRVPMFTVENTRPEFFWVTNYFETLLSSVLWLPCTSASTAVRYRRLLHTWAAKTSSLIDFVSWQGHDFSFRGMSSPEAAALSGAAHLLSFTGTDCIPAIELLENYYDGVGLIGGSVPATEHSVMCAGGKDNELETFRRLLKLYPTGILSVVSDTWDLWHVVETILPQLKDEIMARDGKLVIRPDSGDPVDILCGVANGNKQWDGFDETARRLELQGKGLVQALYDIFGGKRNEAGYTELDPHIGCIYGDSITEDRAQQICERLAAKRFASTNVVLGIGSYTYQYVTRDTNGFAIKATWVQINGKEHAIFKDPKTDDGTKKSARGRIVVRENPDGKLVLEDGLDLQGQFERTDHDLLQPVWVNGRFLRRQNLAEIRAIVAKYTNQ